MSRLTHGKQSFSIESLFNLVGKAIKSKKRLPLFIFRMGARILHALVLVSMLVSSAVSAGEVQARAEESNDSHGKIDKAAGRPAQYTHPQPRIGPRTVEPETVSPLTFIPITCVANCTQVNSGTISFSGSGSASGAWQWRPPVSFERGIPKMRVYYSIKGLRIVSSNAGCGLTRNHRVEVDVTPGKNFYSSPTVAVGPGGSHEFVVPTIDTYFDHTNVINRDTAVRWVVVKGGINCSVSFTWSVDEIIVSSQPIEFSVIDDNSTVNLAPCLDGGDCQATKGTLSGATGKAGDPINTRTGAFSYTNPDLSIPTSAGDLIFQRSYSSAAVEQPANLLGPGWVHNHAARLIPPGDPEGRTDFAIFRGVAGNDYLFKVNPNGTFMAGPGITATLTRSSGPPVTYTVKTSAQSSFTFNNEGRLMSRKDEQGRAFTYTYDAGNKLTLVSADTGSRYLAFTYDAQGRIVSVSDHTGRETEYSYNVAGDLTGYVDVLGQTWTYTYDSGHHITEVTDPNSKTVVRNEYASPAAQFTAGNQEYLGSNSPNLDLGNTSFTWAGWVYLDSMPGNYNSMIVAKRRGAAANQADYRLYLLGSGQDRFRFDINNGGVGVTASTSVPVTAGKWYFVSAWHDAVTDQIGIQVDNGTNYTAPTNNVSPGNSTNPLYIGWQYNVNDYYLDGRMDELGLWARVLTANERAGLYNTGEGLLYPFPADNASLNTNIISLWRLDETSGTRADAAGGNDLSDFGGVGQAPGINIGGDAIASAALRQYNGEGELVVDLEYNSDGTTTVTDALGNETKHTYDFRNSLVDQTDPLGNDVDNTYDVNFRPLTITDANNNTTNLTWSADGSNLTRIVDAAGNQTDITYNALNLPTSVVDPRDFLTTFTYTGMNLTSTTNALNQTTTYTYDAQNQLTSVTDPLNHTTSYTYDSHGQRISMTDTLNNTWTYTYDAFGRLVDTTDPLGHVTHNVYDAAGRLTSVTQNYDPSKSLNEDAVWNIITGYAYDVRGNQISVTDPVGRVTQYEYDDADRLTRTIDSAGNQTTNAYNAAGQLIAVTDALNRMTQYAYDDAGRLLSTTDALNHVSGSIYNPDGTVASTTDELGRATSYTYDSLKRVITVTLPNGGETHNTYDESGNLAITTDALGNETTYEYDALNRLILTTDPLNNETEHFYNAAGQLIQTVDARGNATTYGYDAAGRQISVTDALNNVTTYEYDALGRRISVTDANGKQTTFTYDEMSRTSAVTNALEQTTVTAYDALGRVFVVTDANLNSVSFAYTNLNQLFYQTDALNNSTSFTYDGAGNRITVTDANNHTTTTAYDDLNRPITFTDANNNSSSNVYDAAGNLLTSSDALGNDITYGYNALNQPNVITDPLNNETRNLYNARGDLVLTTDAEGIVTKYEYDALARLAAVVENFQAGIPADAETNVRTEYTYDENGNRLSILDANGHLTSFTYDALNRLITESDALNHTWTTAYDAAGNRIAMTDANGATTHYEYDDAYRLLTIDYASSADVTFTYDNAGRRLTMNDELGTTSWEYNARNQITAITDPFGKTVEYAYDVAGNKTAITYADGRTVSYLYDPADRLTLVNGLSNAVEYTYDNANRLTAVARPNNINTAYSYDDASRLLSITHAQDVELLSSFLYNYDNMGNRVQAIENVKSPELPSGPTPTPISSPTETVPFTGTPTETITPTFETGTPEFTPTETLTSIPTATNTNIPSIPFDDVTQDDFDSATLDPAWEWYVREPQWSLSNVPGKFQMIVPTFREHWGAYDVAPTLRRTDMGDGDFVIETSVDVNANSVPTHHQFGLMVGFSQHDRIWLGVDSDGPLVIIRSGTGAHNYLADHSMPLILRIEKTEDQYTFMYKADIDDEWITLWVETITNPVAYVGVQVRTYHTTSADAILDVDSFRLERSSPTPDVIVDEFDGPELDPAWEWYINPVTWSLSANPGHFQFTVPVGLTHMNDDSPIDNAPSIRRTDMGNGDFAIETRAEQEPGSSVESYTVDLTVGYDQIDQLWCRVNAVGEGALTRSGYSSPPVTQIGNLPMTMRLEKHGDLYTCMYKANPTDSWTILDSLIVDRPVAYVGVQVRSARITSSPLDAIIDVDYFRLEKPSPSMLTATAAASSPTPTGTDTPIPADTLIPTETMTPTLTAPPFDTLTPTLTLTPSLTFTPTISPAATSTNTPVPPSGPVTINYTYDSLDRLTAADYSTGEFYNYTYDIVGNRLTEQSHLETNAYVYDDANRLASVNSVNYTFDDNGNLLNDGVSTYTYDAANRLSTVSGPSSATYAYNGLGDRYQQSVGSQTTTSILDLNAGLTQVLDDGDNAYLYGLGRVAQVNTSTEYFMGDAIGSVRQLVEGEDIVLAKSYAPYGEDLYSNGSRESAFAYTGEQTDPNGLVYLRARYYGSNDGRFLSRDTWGGNVDSPLSLNRWNYAKSNPIVFNDPTGNYAQSTHYEVTLSIAKTVGRYSCVGVICAYVDTIALIIASGNRHMDDCPLSADPRCSGGGAGELHFVSPADALRNSNAAINARNPFIFGATLHQIQDSYTHWSEGYRDLPLGHGVPSFKAGCDGSDSPCARSSSKIQEFYKYNSRKDIIHYLSQRYSPAMLSSVSDDKLIDLYSQELGPDGTVNIRTGMGVVTSTNLRGYFGYDTDHDFGFTQRDLAMRQQTRELATSFFQNYKVDTFGCFPTPIWFLFETTSDEAVKNFLETGGG